MYAYKIISKNWNSRPGSQLTIIRDFLVALNEESSTLDFNDFRFGPPMLALYFTKLVKDFDRFKIARGSDSTYLQNIKFLEGFSPESVENWVDYLNLFNIKSYLPIIRFSTGNSASDTQVRNDLISHIGRMIRQITGIPMNYYMGVSYLLSELTENIVEHSRHDSGWVSFQYYPTEGFMDICLADSGIGILGSYQNYQGEKDYSYVKNHLDAVEAMIKGGSTKSLKERGFGVHTSREMLVDGLRGTFIFLSGNALLHNYDLLDFQVESPGSLAFLRIPIRNQKANFNLYKYTE